MQTTRRATVPALEALMEQPIKVLDQGFIRVVDYMGNDGAIVQAARVSYGDGTEKSSTDAALIRYLMRHRHTTPFEMCEIKLHLKMPIFVARQWMRHRTASINEISGRYSVMREEFYVPALQDIALQSGSNKQGRGEVVDPAFGEDVRATIGGVGDACFEVYTSLLNGEDDPAQGISRELARVVLPLATYTEFYWKVNLHNLVHFLGLRVDPHAQFEIRAYANEIVHILDLWVPEAARAMRDFRTNTLTVSAQARKIIERRMLGETVTRENSGLPKREWDDLVAAFPPGVF